MKTKFFKTNLIIGFLLLAFATKAHASFMAAPMKFDCSIEAGESQSYSFWVNNKSDKPLRLKIYTNDFWVGPSGAEVFYESGHIEHSCSPWIELDTEELELAAQETATIQFKVTVPEGIYGTYWGMIFVEQTSTPKLHKAKEGERSFSISTFQRVGIRIYTETPDTKLGQGAIDLVKAVKDPKTGFYRIEVGFKNDSSTLLKCKGKIEITDENGELIETLDIIKFNSYSKSYRILNELIKKELSPGEYTILAIIDDGNEDLVAGETQFTVD